MANIRIKDLPSDATPKQDDIVPIDLAGTRGTEIKALVEAGRPTASKEEAEVGTDAHKAMTPLTTKQAIDAQVGAAYVPKTVSVNVGDGLAGGGNLSGDVTVSLTQDNIDRLNKVDSVEEGATKNDTDERLRDRSTHTGEQGINTVSGLQDALDSKATLEQGKKADTALQAPGGLLGEVLVKNSNTDNDVAWVASEAATAVSYGPQELTEDQQAQARNNIGVPTAITAAVSGNMPGRAYPRVSGGGHLDIVWGQVADQPLHILGAASDTPDVRPYAPASIKVGSATKADRADGLSPGGWDTNHIQNQLNWRVTDTRFSGFIEHSFNIPASGSFGNEVPGAPGYVLTGIWTYGPRYLAVGFRQPQINIPNVGWRALGSWA